MTSSFGAKIIHDFSRAAKTYDNYAYLQRKIADQLFVQNMNLWKPEGDSPHQNNRILDIGCGTGYFHELLRKNKIYSPLMQLDISPEMCKISANYASSQEYGDTFTCNADMHTLPFAHGAFANIFSSMTMQWADNLGKCVQEAKKVLTKNGHFVLSLVGKGSMPELTNAFLLSGRTPPIHNFADISELQFHLNQSGLSIKSLYQDNITMLHKDFNSLLRSIKGVGASYKNAQAAGLKGKNYFTGIESIYRKEFQNGDGLPLSWNIIYAIAEND